MSEPRYDSDGNPAPPWGCGKFVGLSAKGDPLPCEWGNLCPDCAGRVGRLCIPCCHPMDGEHPSDGCRMEGCPCVYSHYAGFLVTHDEFPNGLRCAECSVELLPGEHYYESSTVDVVGDTPIVLLVCADCRGQTPSVDLPVPMRQAMEGAAILAELDGESP